MAAEPGWRRVRIGELAEVKHGYAFEGQYFTDDPTDDVLVTPGNFNIGGGFNASKQKFYRGPVPDEFVLVPGDVVVTMTDLSKAADTLGYGARVPYVPGKRLLHNQRIGRIRFKTDAIDPGFLHYVLRTSEYRHVIVGSASGSTVKHTSPSRIEACVVSLPPPTEQRAIASVLDSLEAKIELNRRMNETLEAMARALFKSWFVDFDPVRAKRERRQPVGMDAETARLFPDAFEESEIGEVPKGWRVADVYSLAAVDYGAPYASARFNEKRIGRPIIRIRDLADQAPRVWTDEVHPRDVVISPGDVLVGMDGEFRARVWSGDVSVLNQRVCRFRPLNADDATYVRLSIEEPLMFVERTEVATTVIHLGKGDIDRFRIVVPSRPVLGAFARLVGSLIARQLVSSGEGRSLACLRDALLPRLLSGELRVRNAEQLASEVL